MTLEETLKANKEEYRKTLIEKIKKARKQRRKDTILFYIILTYILVSFVLAMKGMM